MACHQLTYDGNAFFTLEGRMTDELPLRRAIYNELKDYAVTVLLDRRGRPFAETVRACTDWIVKRNGFTPAVVPEAAFDPLYSTWYAYLQDVSDKPLEEEARLAASLGMKTMILDDGWQKGDSVDFYSATGDWMPVPSRSTCSGWPCRSSATSRRSGRSSRRSS